MKDLYMVSCWSGEYMEEQGEDEMVVGIDNAMKLAEIYKGYDWPYVEGGGVWIYTTKIGEGGIIRKGETVFSWTV